MNKVLFFTAICIIVISAIGIIYFAFTPSVNHCASSNPGGLGPAVCVYRESINWRGIGSSLATLAFGIILTTHSYKRLRNKK